MGLKKITVATIIILLAAGIAAAVIWANAGENESEKSVVGIWHITTESIEYENHPTKRFTVSAYLVFNSSRTGYGRGYCKGHLSELTHNNFTWFYKYYRTLEIKLDDPYYSENFTFLYDINEESISLVYLDGEKYGRRTVLYGYLVDEIPKPLEKNLFTGNVTFLRNESNLASGWANFTINVTSPEEGVLPERVNVSIAKASPDMVGDSTRLNFTHSMPVRGEWTYLDTDSDGKISTGDKLVVHARSFRRIDWYYKLIITRPGFAGVLSTWISMGLIRGALKPISNEEDLHSGWINSTVNLSSPENLRAEDIYVEIVKERYCSIGYEKRVKIKYTDGNPRDGEWTYVDMDSSGGISKGDIVVVHFKNLTTNYKGEANYTTLLMIPYYYFGYLFTYLTLDALDASMKLDDNNSSIQQGWINISFALLNPNGLNVHYVHIIINHMYELNYADKINGNNQWSYEDLDGDGKLSDGDRITIHSTLINGTARSTIHLYYDFYYSSTCLCIGP